MTLPKLSELPRPVQLIVAAGSLAVALTAIVVPTVWALDTRYVTVASVEHAFLTRDIRDIKRMIRKLEFLKTTDAITDAQAWELNDLKGELEELKDEESK